MRSRSRRAALAASAVPALLVLAVGMPPASASPSAYSGDAYAVGWSGVQAGLSTVPDTRLVEVGPFNGSTPQSGEASVASADTNPLLSVLPVRARATTIGSSVSEDANSSSSSSSVQTVDVTSTADGSSLVHAEAASVGTSATCSGSPHATSRVLSLSVAGQVVNVDVIATSTTTVGNVATVTVNRKSITNGATYKSAAIDAVVVTFPSNGALASVVTGTIVIGHSESDVTCS